MLTKKYDDVSAFNFDGVNVSITPVASSGIIPRPFSVQFIKYPSLFLFIPSTIPEESDAYFIVVPTPFKGDHEPDISYVEAASRTVIPFLKEGDLFVIESTSPVGTTDKIQNIIFTLRPELKDKIYIAYCPERVLPGNVIYELIHNDRVIGGMNDDSTDKAIDFYSRFVQGNLHRTNCKTAEMCKLTENLWNNLEKREK